MVLTKIIPGELKLVIFVNKVTEKLEIKLTFSDWLLVILKFQNCFRDW